MRVTGLLRDPDIGYLETTKSSAQFCKLLGVFCFIQNFEQARFCIKQKIPSAMQKGFVRRGGRIRTCELPDFPSGRDDVGILCKKSQK